MLEILIIVGGLLLDQGTKALARGLLLDLPGQSFHLVDGVFHFTYLQNTGAAFGMLSGMQAAFLVLTVLACGALVYVLLTKRQRLGIWMRVSLSMILCGALGNFIDRLLFGYVRDFLHFALIDFAVFNVADSLITVGTIIFAVYVFFIADRKPKPDESSEEDADNA